jgi:hypothetical protein
MGFRFRKSINLGRGSRVNLSKRGVGFSAGTRGARYSVGPRGRSWTFSIPGTGLSYQTRARGRRRRATRGSCCCLGVLALALAPLALASLVGLGWWLLSEGSAEAVPGKGEGPVADGSVVRD